MSVPTYTEFIDGDVERRIIDLWARSDKPYADTDIRHYLWKLLREQATWEQVEADFGIAPPPDPDWGHAVDIRPGFQTWPADPWAIRCDFDSGAAWVDSTEAATWNPNEQERLIRQSVDRGYQWMVCSIVYGGGNAHPGGTYDGFAGQARSFWDWIDRLTAAKITPIVVPFQGSQPSWQKVVYYRNEWARDHIGDWATRLWMRTNGHAVFMCGFEWNKKFEAFDGDKDHRGPGELWGWAAAGQMWAAPIKAAVPQMPVLLHTLPGCYGPETGEGGRDWTPAGYWQHEGSALDGLAMQFELDQRHSDNYYRDEIGKAKRIIGTKRLYAAEYVRPGESFKGSVNVGEDRARALGRLCLEAGCVGVMNGVR